MHRLNPQHSTSNLVYYNAALFAPTEGKTVIAAISDPRSEPIIGVPEDFECSVVRFDISANLLPPIVIPMPLPPALGANVPSNLSVTLRSLGVDTQVIVNFSVFSVETSGFVYSIEEFIARVNAAFAAAFAAMAPVAGVTSPPIFAFNPVTQLISLYAQSTYVGGPEIYVNSQLYNYIESMPAAFFSYNSATGRDFRLQIESPSALAVPAAGAPRAGYPISIQNIINQVQSISQAGPSLASMNGVRSVFITTSMPIDSEGLPTSISPNQNANNSSNKERILSDFLVSTEPGNNPVVDRISLSYLPTAEYRMVQMRGTQPLVLIDLKWWYTLQDGRSREMSIPPGGSANAKIMFRRKRAEDLLQH